MRVSAVTSIPSPSPQPGPISAPLLRAIAAAQTQYIADRPETQVFDNLLGTVLNLTASQYGFLGEVLYDDQGQPYLHAHTLTNIAWNSETQALYERAASEGLLFRKLASLYGAALTSGQPVIANDPPSDPRASGLPPGHPPLKAFLALPAYNGTSLTGLIGIANRPGGYDLDIVEMLQPLCSTVATLITFKRERQGRQLAEQRLSEILSTLDDVVWSADIATNSVTYASRACLTLYGEPPIAFQADRDLWAKMVHEDDQAEVRRANRLAIENCQPLDIIYRIRRRDRTIRWVRTRMTPVQDIDGRLTRLDGITSDITESQNRQAQLEEQARRLAMLNQELADAKAAAEASNQAKSRFLAYMSHELRTPLNAVLGFAEMMQMDALELGIPPAYAEYCGVIHDSGEHLLALINDVLDMSKIEAGRMSIVCEPVDVAALGESCRNLLTGLARTHHITLNIELPDKPSFLWADARAIKQILINLAGNGIKFTRPGGAVTISFRPTPEGGYTLQVRDTGIGIAESDLARVVEPFGQIDSDLARQHRGTGLGLPLVRALTDLHGGHFTLASKPGSGTVATLYFPPPQDSSVNIPPARRRRRLVPDPQRRSLRILAVDGAASLRRLYHDLLHPLGHQVVVTDCMKYDDDIGNTFDLILFDLGLPPSEGITRLTEWCHALPDQVPVIATSASVLNNEEAAALAAGARAFLPKPFALARLLDTVSALTPNATEPA